MKLPVLLLVLLAVGCSSRLNADIIKCKDGKVFHGVVKEETAKRVTVSIEGAEVVFPRAQIESIKKQSAEEDAKLDTEWKKLDEHYKEESREWEKRDAQLGSPDIEPTLPPLELPPVEEPEEPQEPEAIVFPAEPPPPPGRQPAGPAKPNKVRERLEWEQKVRKAIHEKKVIPGMTPHQVTSAWGFADSTCPVDNIDTHTNRWTYHRPEGPVYVYFKNGVVVSSVQ